jgi:hypothetical protein
MLVERVVQWIHESLAYLFSLQISASKETEWTVMRIKKKVFWVCGSLLTLNLNRLRGEH